MAGRPTSHFVQPDVQLHRQPFLGSFSDCVYSHCMQFHCVHFYPILQYPLLSLHIEYASHSHYRATFSCGLSPTLSLSLSPSW